jgi:hypothetical protein
MRINTIAILSLLTLSSNCRAADWWLIHIDMDSVSFIDVESIKDYEYTKKRAGYKSLIEMELQLEHFSFITV